MANFRRSLIHVDFFIRRKKKKDKRRNTVTEGDTKELKDVLQNIINEECQRTAMPTFMSNGDTFTHENDQNSKFHNEINKTTSAEKNNNSSESDASSIIITNFNTADVNSEEKNKINATKNESVKFDSKILQASETIKPCSGNKRKPKSHIPISTVSAAMNVAVEMRQLNVKNKVEDQSSSGNWSYSSDINSSDPENKTNSSDNNRYVINTDLNDIDTSVSNGKAYRNSSTVMSKNLEELNSSVNKEIKETEVSSCTSSDNNTAHDDATSNGTSTESDTFFISSDESDDSSDIIFKNNYGSSLSLSTVSDGSLNSLLSQTGTEMTSSTGTLTSIGLEQLPTPPPPPPPPAIVAATVTDTEVTNICGQLDLLNKECKLQKQEKIARTSGSVKSNKEHKSAQKSRKYSKAEKADLLKYSTENSKNIFSTLINKKSKTKEQNKHKISQNKINKLENQPHFNVYGSSSPKIAKPISLFLKDNISPVKENEPRNYLQSFSSNQSKPAQEIFSENKSKNVKSEFSVPLNNNSPLHKTHTPTNVSSTHDASKVEVPLKYVQKVTVTPIQRRTGSEHSNSIAACKKSLFKEGIYQQQITETNTDYKPKQNAISSTDSNNGKVFYFENPKPQYPIAVQTAKPKSAARVLLDPDGRVLQCTNSLDRRFYHPIPANKYTNNINTNHPVRYQVNGEVINSEDKTNLLNHNYVQYFPSADKDSKFSNPLLMTNNRPNSIAIAYERQNSEGYETSRYPNFLITPPEQNHSEIVHFRASTRTNMRQTSCPETVYGRNSKEINGGNTFQSTHTMLPPNPNISGLPSNETMLTQHNINLHSKQIEKMGIPSFEENNCRNTEDMFYNSLKKNSHSLLNTEMVKPQQSTMSTEDLFAVIHNCKKRMNIKTDSDISLTSSSSRSSSPSYLRPTSSKGALAETGFLSPRSSSSFDSSRDRRSWADFRPTNSMPPERKSLASDRLGPTKPTSMHDFKMLLLQTRSNSQVLGPRKSAVEMLKVPSSQDKSPKTTSPPFNFSPCNYPSYSVPNSPSSELYLYNGHSTVPFKRNTRARSSLQSRYTMYPPIFEDCSEDFENTRETQQICSETVASDNEQNNIQLQHSVVNNTPENTMHKTRHWL